MKYRGLKGIAWILALMLMGTPVSNIQAASMEGTVTETVSAEGPEVETEVETAEETEADIAEEPEEETAEAAETEEEDLPESPEEEETVGEAEKVTPFLDPVCVPAESEAAFDEDEELALAELDPAAAGDSDEYVASGTCGDDLRFTLDREGYLKITGTGAMTSFVKITDFYTGELVEETIAPWKDYMSSIRYIEIGEGVTSIGYGAFAQAVNLQEISMPSTLESVGANSLSYCTSLTSLVFPDSVKSIYVNACYGCRSLTEVTFGVNLQTLGIAVFGDCSQLSMFHVPDQNTSFCDVDGVLFSKDKKCLVHCPINYEGSSYEIPAGTVTIGEDAFVHNRNMETVTIPSTVRTIEAGAFFNAVGLKRITIPATVQSIEYQTFEYCTNLEELIIKAPVDTIPYGFAAGCEHLSKVVLPSTVKTIGAHAFNSSTALSEVEWPAGLEKIGMYAFHNTGVTEYPDWLEKQSDGSWIKVETLTITGTYNQTKARAMLTQINAYRTGGKAWYYNSSNSKKSLGTLSALNYDYNLEKAAMERAAEIVLSFSHNRLTGSNLMGVNVNGSVVYGENIAYNYSGV